MMRRTPTLLYIPACIAAAGILVPLFYLVLRSAEAEGPVIASLILRRNTFVLLSNTLLLASGVLLSSLAISLPLAWITERTSIRGRKVISLLGVIPLAVPGYVMAYALLSIGGNYGLSARLLGTSVPRISGYWGAVLALTLYCYPYLYLNIRTALAGLDPALEETAGSLGYSPVNIFFRVILPHLRSALLAGSMIIVLYVLGDFGVVALMRYEVFSYAIYTQYTGAFDRTYAALLSLILVTISMVFLISEFLLIRKVRTARIGSGSQRRHHRSSLSIFSLAAYVFVVTLAGLSVLLPIASLLLWMRHASPWHVLPRVLQSFLRSAGAAGPAAVMAVSLALPISYLHIRYPGRLSRLSERSAYIGYAIPPLTLGLAFVFFSIRAIPGWYQTLPILVAAYGLNFLALAMGPVRSSLLHLPRRIEEAARSLGCSMPRVITGITIPLLSRGILASLALVFVMAMKELPIALLLSPPGFTTLSMAVFSRTSEALFAEAAPFAAAIILLSTIVVGVLLHYEGSSDAPA